MKAPGHWKYVVALSLWLSAGAARAEISLTTLDRTVQNHLENVDEFREVKARAERLGLRAWLFGGSAAAVVHHARAQVLAAGDVAATPDFAEIFRWNQDVDVVVDARDAMSDEEILARAVELESQLMQLFPHLPGERARWEVRLLRSPRGDKAPLLGDTYLWDQNNDSASIGLAEITTPPSGERRIRDGSHWSAPQSVFWNDAAQGRITLIPAARHDHTERSREGLNPPLFAAVRFLTKKHQYGLSTDAESLALMDALVQTSRDQLAQGTFPKDPYIAQWLHHNVRKMIANAQDVAALWDDLDHWRLRLLLQQVGGDPERADTVAWWMNKLPLRARAFGQGLATAKSLGITLVTHLTTDAATYEAIRRSPERPNLFQSRDGAKGERALFGDGVYVTRGVVEPPGGAFAVRMSLQPDAVLGEDFLLLEKDDAILVLNQAALRLEKTEVAADPVWFFDQVATLDAQAKPNFGVLAQWRRRVASRFSLEKGERRQHIVDLVRTALEGPIENADHLLREWFLMPSSTLHPELFAMLLARVTEPGASKVILQALQAPHWRRAPQARTGVFTLLGASLGSFREADVEMQLAARVLRPDDAWTTDWFEDAVVRLTLLHAAEHTLVDTVFLAPGFSASPHAAAAVKRFADFSFHRPEAARMFATSNAWPLHPEAISIARHFAPELPALEFLYRSVRWRPTFTRVGADLTSARRFQRWLLARKENTCASGLILPSGVN